MGEQIRWNRDTRETILEARDKLEEMGMVRPTIRAVLYYLLQLPDWTKHHYNTLCRRLGEWRDKGLVPFGLFSDDGAGSSYVPLTTQEVNRRIRALKDAVVIGPPKDGTIRVVFVEHAGMVDTIAGFLDDQVPVVSSQGQLRREHLHSLLTQVERVAEEVDAKGVKLYALVDYDKSGRRIYDAHRRWIRDQFGYEMELWAVTEDQVREAGLSPLEKHQLDGWMARYGPQRVKQELRDTLGL